jgi:hypothetical protein
LKSLSAPAVFAGVRFEAVVSWARDKIGAEGACIPVVATNTPAIALYRGLERILVDRMEASDRQEYAQNQ